MIRADGIRLAYGDRLVLSDVSLAVRSGEVVALLGPNGAGKTTLLRVLSGVLRPQAGSVHLDGEPRPLWELAPRQLARRIAVVEQDLSPAFDFTVEEVVAMGRTPHLGWLRPPSRKDHDAVRQALSLTGTEALAARPVLTLSSGERQRVFIALGLAQEPQVLLLDEPMAHLDIRYQVEVLQLVRRLAQGGLAVAMSIHDLNLAGFADRAALLGCGRMLALGPPSAVLTAALIAEAFGAQVEVLPGPLIVPVALRGLAP